MSFDDLIGGLSSDATLITDRAASFGEAYFGVPQAQAAADTALANASAEASKASATAEVTKAVIYAGVVIVGVAVAGLFGAFLIGKR